jgi:hypothetical protein
MGRGSSSARRRVMADTSPRWVDALLPSLPVSHWVLSFSSAMALWMLALPSVDLGQCLLPARASVAGERGRFLCEGAGAVVIATALP